MLTGTGKLELQVPRDRFEPQLIAKYRRRFPNFDEKIISLYTTHATASAAAAAPIAATTP